MRRKGIAQLEEENNKLWQENSRLWEKNERLAGMVENYQRLKKKPMITKVMTIPTRVTTTR